jgi:ribonucleoside-diphosphate reductase beta chain
MIRMDAAHAPSTGIDRDHRSYQYYRTEVQRHWDPADVDLSEDADALVEAPEPVLDGVRSALAKFGAGEQSVTADLAPLAVVLDGIEDQSFIATQLYEEAKHADFFDRYWREVITPVEREQGLELSSPADDRWFDADYDELFERQEEYLDALLEDDSPATRARAYSVYHLVVEGIFARTGYHGLQTIYGEEYEEPPTLPGLVEGILLIQGDEGRHVGFGVAKLRELVHEEGVDPDVIRDTVNELVTLVQGSLAADMERGEANPEVAEVDVDLVEYAMEKHNERMAEITAAD